MDPGGWGVRGNERKNIAAIHPCHSAGNFGVTTPVYFSLRSRRKKNLTVSMDRLDKQNVAISCIFHLTSTAEVVSELCLFCRNSLISELLGYEPRVFGNGFDCHRIPGDLRISLYLIELISGYRDKD